MANVLDPYAHEGAGASWHDGPPQPGPTSPGPDTVLQLYVPAGHTELDYGAGQTPGIRMATDLHAHLSTRITPTTISLGDAAGPGIMSGDPAGLQIFTAGAKRELINLSVEESYQQTKKEVVGGFHTLRLNDGHFFGVTKDAELRFGANKSERIEGSSTIEVMGKKSEVVHGDRSWEMHDKAETIHGDTEWKHHGKKISYTYGFVNDVYFAEKSTLVAGLSMSLNVGAVLGASISYQYSMVAGNKIETVLQNVVATSKSVKMSIDNIALTKNNFEKKKSGYTLTEDELSIFKKGHMLTTAQFNIFK